MLADNSAENEKVLLDAGFTKEQIAESLDHDEYNDIDLTYLAIHVAGVYCWVHSKGFVEEKVYKTWLEGGAE